MIKPIFILKTNEPITEEQYEMLVQVVSEFSANNGMYVDDTLEERSK